MTKKSNEDFESAKQGVDQDTQQGHLAGQLIRCFRAHQASLLIKLVIAWRRLISSLQVLRLTNLSCFFRPFILFLFCFLLHSFSSRIHFFLHTLHTLSACLSYTGSTLNLISTTRVGAKLILTTNPVKHLIRNDMNHTKTLINKNHYDRNIDPHVRNQLERPNTIIS